MPRPQIDHVVVLILENRSFDHLFGFLDHPSPDFPRLRGDEFIGQVKVSPTARYHIDSPDHSHDGVIAQLFGGESFPKGQKFHFKDGWPTHGNNKGFVESYRHVCDGDKDRAARIMRCFHPETIPVMATLAKEYAVFTNWYSSVPGETWPNRDFAVAARSFGHVDQYYWTRPKGSSIFEKLAGEGKSFRIYHDSVAHTFLYPGLYGRGAFHGMKQFFDDVAAEKLPHYSYIEPDFGLGSSKWYIDLTNAALGNKGAGDDYGNSQHPGQASSSAEFVAGEHLVAGIYNALRATMKKHPGSEQDSLFARTLFLITYDEHGGFYDRKTPPLTVQPTPQDKTDAGFKFDLLGLRVPAILISPWIPRNTIIDEQFDHASIPATVRNLFAPTIPPLTARDQHAARFHLVGIGPDPSLRPLADLPEVKAFSLKQATAAMNKHGAPASKADKLYAPAATLKQDWTYVAQTANKLLPPPDLGVAAIDPDKDPKKFAKDVVARMHRDLRAERAPAPIAMPPHVPVKPPPPAPYDPTELPRAATRKLRVYAFDPSRGRVVDNSMTLELANHELDKGPVEVSGELGSRLAVIDYDGSTKTYYKHIDLDDPRVSLTNGLTPSESDVRFHQQMVYAVARDTITHFEAALGRTIHWRRADRQPGDPRGWLPGDVLTLGLHPHAMQAANAYYSPSAHGVLFGYFMADHSRATRSLPGQPVFTCLSHDIIVHEVTHAILDGERAHFLEQTNLDVAAFHEGFADLAALFRHFTHHEVLLDTLERTGGKLYNYQLRPEAALGDRMPGAKSVQPMFAAQIAEDNPLVGLAHQFGDATGLRGALRLALGTPPTPTAYQRITEPHQRGSILVAAVFDAFFSIYTKRTADLWAIYRAGGGSDTPIDLPRPLAGQLCKVAIDTATQFFQIVVRAIDYCPPVDLTFGEFLRAMITSEVDRDLRDPDGVREALMQAFRSRGILPDGAQFFSEDALCWSRGDRLPKVPNLSFDPVQLSPDDKDRTAAVLHAYLANNHVRSVLGLEPDRDITLKSFHPLFRTVDGRLQRDLVVEVIQTRLIAFDNSTSRYPYRAGVTLIISSTGQVRWFVSKPMNDRERDLRQQEFLGLQGLEGDIQPSQLHVDFAGIHGGV